MERTIRTPHVNAITTHKCQGSTYAEVAVRPENNMPRSAVYIACSRVTKLDGLNIVGDFYGSWGSKLKKNLYALFVFE